MIASAPGWLERHEVSDMVFVDDGRVDDPGVVSSVRDHEPASGDLHLCTVGTPRVRAELLEVLAARGAELASFVHPSVVRFSPTAWPVGTIAYPHVTVSCDVVLGAAPFLSTGATLGHDVSVGDHVTISGAVQLLGGSHVGDRAFLGAGAVVLPRARVSADATVGAGSVVLRRVPRGRTVFGVPALPVD